VERMQNHHPLPQYFEGLFLKVGERMQIPPMFFLEKIKIKNQVLSFILRMKKPHFKLISISSISFRAFLKVEERMQNSYIFLFSFK
jgi:hypothetical protein